MNPDPGAMDVIDLIGLTIVFGGTLALAMWWLFYSPQTSTERNSRKAVGIVLRLAFVFAVITGILHYLLGVSLAVLIVIVLVSVIWSAMISMETPPGNEFHEFLIWFVLFTPFYITREFVMGFPCRKELVLEPRSCEIAIQSLEHLVHEDAVVTSPLRPTGSVAISGNDHPARSDDGTFVDVGTNVTVSGFVASLLIVTRVTPEMKSTEQCPR